MNRILALAFVLFGTVGSAQDSLSVDTSVMIANKLDTLWSVMQQITIQRQGVVNVIRAFEEDYYNRTDSSYYSTLDVEFTGEWVLPLDSTLARFVTLDSPTEAVEVIKDDLMNSYERVKNGRKIAFQPLAKDMRAFRLILEDKTHYMYFVGNGLFASINGLYVRKLQ